MELLFDLLGLLPWIPSHPHSSDLGSSSGETEETAGTDLKLVAAKSETSGYYLSCEVQERFVDLKLLGPGKSGLLPVA